MRTLGMWSGIGLCLLLGTYMMGVDLETFIHPASALQVFGPMLITALFWWKPSQFPTLCRRILDQSLSKEERLRLSALSQMGYLAGCFSFIVGMIHVLQNLSEASKIGMGLAVAITSFVYGLIPSLLLLALPPANTKKASSSKLTLMYGAGGVGGALLIFFVSLYSLSNV
jgi:flagellar motor component MotA